MPSAVTVRTEGARPPGFRQCIAGHLHGLYSIYRLGLFGPMARWRKQFHDAVGIDLRGRPRRRHLPRPENPQELPGPHRQPQTPLKGGCGCGPGRHLLTKRRRHVPTAEGTGPSVFGWSPTPPSARPEHGFRARGLDTDHPSEGGGVVGKCRHRRIGKCRQLCRLRFAGEGPRIVGKCRQPVDKLGPGDRGHEAVPLPIWMACDIGIPAALIYGTRPSSSPRLLFGLDEARQVLRSGRHHPVEHVLVEGGDVVGGDEGRGAMGDELVIDGGEALDRVRSAARSSASRPSAGLVMRPETSRSCRGRRAPRSRSDRRGGVDHRRRGRRSAFRR